MFDQSSVCRRSVYTIFRVNVLGFRSLASLTLCWDFAVFIRTFTSFLLCLNCSQNLLRLYV